ncbi:nucleotidyltransferase domain-containing protein [Archaeoglobus sp.]
MLRTIIKGLAGRYFGSVKVYVFGFAVRGDYHVMLSDIDVAVVTGCEDRELIYRFTKAGSQQKFLEII